MALLVGTLFTFTTGVLTIAHRWNEKVGLRIRSDRCVGRLALRLREVLNRADQSNQRLRSLRTLLQTALSTGRLETAAALRKLITIEGGVRVAIKAAWSASFPLSQTEEDCRGKEVPWIVSASQRFPYQEVPPDVLGPSPWTGKGQISRGITLRISNTKISSEAELYCKTPSSDWKARWIRSGLD